MPTLTIAGKTIQLSTSHVIGSAPSCNLAVSHPSLSPQHARVFRQGTDWFLEDLMTEAGSMLNGKRITATSKLAQDDKIQLGEVQLVFTLLEPSQVKNDATVPMADAQALVGREISGFLVTAFIRHETTGPLYKAKHTISEKDVLFWVFHPELVNSEGPDFIKRFKDAIAPLNAPEHPNLLRVYQFGQHGEYFWYVTDLPVGTSLEEYIKLGFSPSAAIETTLAICRHLAVFHKTGLTHGEIRPSLIYLDDARQIRLASIGIAALGTKNCRRLLCAPGSRQVHYLDPELVQSGAGNVKSDLYSVGCMMVEMLTGTPPYPGESSEAIIKAHAVQPVPRLAATTKLPPALDDVLQGMLTKTHLHRFDSFEPAIEAISAILSPTSSGKSAPQAAVPAKSGIPGIALAIAAAVVIAIAALWFVFSGDSRIKDIASHPPVQPAGPLQEADLPNLIMVHVEDQHPLRQGTGTVSRVTSGHGAGLLLSDAPPAVGAQVYAMPAGTIYLCDKPPLRFVPKIMVKDGELPKGVSEYPLYRHVLSKAVDGVKAQIAAREQERKDKEAKLAEEERRKAELAAQERQRAEEERLRKEAEEKAAKEAAELAAKQAAEKARQEAEQQRLAKVKTVTNTLAKLAEKMEKSMISGDKKLDVKNVPRDFANDNKALREEIDVVGNFLKGNPDSVGDVTAHADFPRFDAAQQAFKELCDAANEKTRKFAGYTGQPQQSDPPPVGTPGTSPQQVDQQIQRLMTTIVARERYLNDWIRQNPPSPGTNYNATRLKYIQDYQRETDRLRLQLAQLKLLPNGSPKYTPPPTTPRPYPQP